MQKIHKCNRLLGIAAYGLSKDRRFVIVYPKYCFKRGSYYGCAQIENIKSPDEPPAVYQYETDCPYPD
jgi:hypothetical protein